MSAVAAYLLWCASARRLTARRVVVIGLAAFWFGVIAWFLS